MLYNILMPNYISKEITVASEALRILKFNPEKHWKRVLGLYLIGWIYIFKEKKRSASLGLLTRSTYLIFRHIDDVLDKDLIVENPKEYVQKLRLIVSSRTQPFNKVAKMLEFSLELLEKKAQSAKTGEDVQQLFINAIDAMLFDYERQENRTILSQDELHEYYYQTFTPVLNLMFLGFESKLRVSKETIFSHLAYCQGRIYSIRDLEKDWNVGIINIPLEVLDAANITSTDSFANVVNNPKVKQWIKNEIKVNFQAVIELKQALELSGEKFTIQAVNFSLVDHMLKTLIKLKNAIPRKDSNT